MAYNKEKIIEDICKLVKEGMSKKDLYKTGFTDLMQKGYRKENSEEWITFLDYSTGEKGDLITFHLIDNKVESWERFIPEQKEESQQSEI